MQSSTRLFHVFHHRAKLVETKKLLDQAATWTDIGARGWHDYRGAVGDHISLKIRKTRRCYLAEGLALAKIFRAVEVRLSVGKWAPVQPSVARRLSKQRGE